MEQSAMNLKCFLLTLVLAFVAFSAIAADPLVFNDPAMEERYYDLTAELRCAVCQNQSLADSDAELAQDLRKEIYDMMMAGQDNDQIKTFMVDRYGDFVLYRPAMEGNTLALWLMPGVLLGIGAIAVFFTVRNRNHKLAAERQKG
jgi:cytochrome c-type biogenesis protein CcmH